MKLNTYRSNFNFPKKMSSFQNLTLNIQRILQHMLPNPKPKNTMTHYTQSSVLKTFQFYYILIYIIYKYL